MLNSQTSDDMKGSGALAKANDEIMRGWDWRAGTSKDTTGADVLRMMRVGLARDIAKHWIDSEITG